MIIITLMEVLMNKGFKRAFTLTETLVMAAVISIIAVISIVSLKNARPDRDAMMVRKAFAELSKAVEALANDEELYPSARMVNNTNIKNSALDKNVLMAFNNPCFASEFDNAQKGSGNYNGASINDGDFVDYRYIEGAGVNVFSDTTVYNGASYGSNYKFAYNIGKTMKGKNLNCRSRTCTYTTADGMYWQIEDNMNNGGYAYVNVDINGSKGSRSMTSSTPDLYPFKVDVSGYISIGGKDIVHNSSISVTTIAVVKAQTYLETRDARVKRENLPD